MKKLFFSFLLFFFVITIHAQADSSYKEYTGTYVFPDGGIVTDVTVVMEGDGLVMNSSAGTSALLKLGIDSFSIVAFSGTAVFKRDESNKVKGVHIEAAGYIMDGTKQEGNAWSFRVFQKPSGVMTKEKNKYKTG